VFGGGNATEQSVVQVFTGRAWRQVAHLPTARSDLSAVEVGDRTYVIGGYDGVNVPRQVFSVGTSGGLVRAGTLVIGVRYAATAVVGSRVYVFGGEVNHRELGQVQAFDTATGRTKVVATLPRPLGHAVAATVGGRILLIGGRVDPSTQTAAMWWFDPGSGKFVRAGSLPAATSDSAVASVGDTIWLLGGESTQVTGRVIVIHLS
jgi:N-acetylneuraminic acid mutarotase